MEKGAYESKNQGIEPLNSKVYKADERFEPRVTEVSTYWSFIVKK